MAGMELANWNWKLGKQFVWERYGISLSRSSCLNWLHRLGFAFKRPKKRLLKADETQREAFVAEYAAIVGRMPADRVPGSSSLMRPTSMRPTSERMRSCGGNGCKKDNPPWWSPPVPATEKKASYYSAVCLETGEVEWMELEGNSNSDTSVAFLKQLKERHPGPLKVIWDNAPAHRGESMREYLRTPGLELQLLNLPGYSPDFNGDEAIWG